jgi:transcriptional regulator GlxA family with amidase domain
MRIVVAGINGCLGSGFIGLVDLFWLAQKAILGRTAHDPWEIVTASSDGRAVTDGRGCKLLVDAAFQDIQSCDAVLVPGFVPDDNGCPPEMRGLANATRWFRNQHAQGALVCGSCSGVFLLGEAGLLNERRCTTTWWLHDEMKRRYPKADAAWGAAIIEDRRVISAGGPLSWIDLSLHVIRVLCGADAARLAADFAVIDTAPLSQAVYVPSGHVAAADPLVLAAEKIIRQNGEKPMTARDLSRSLGTSERTLHRRLKQGSGESPGRFIERVRFETARTLLETSTSAVKRIAADVGYQDETSFRRAFRRHSGMTPSGYRAWVQSRRA